MNSEKVPMEKISVVQVKKINKIQSRRVVSNDSKPRRTIHYFTYALNELHVQPPARRARGLRYNAAKGKLLLSPQNPSPVFLTSGVSATYAKVGEADTLGIALDDVLVHTRPGPRGAT